MGRVWLAFAILVVLIVAVFGVRGMVRDERPLVLFLDMDFQPKYHPQGESRFFADGRAQRTPPAGTVPYGGGNYYSDSGAPTAREDYLAEDDGYYRGKQGENYLVHSPVAMTLPLLHRGQTQFNIYCAVCHGPTGRGTGIVKAYGFNEIANLTEPRLRQMSDGQIFHTITNGKGLMKPYAHQVAPADRWAIVAYIRALQRSQTGTLDDVPEPHRTELQNRD